MRSLLMITTSRWQKDVWRRYVPTVGLINRSLFPAQLSQICCQSSEIKLLTRGKNSEAGSFIDVTESERAAFAAVSAFSSTTVIGVPFQQHRIALPKSHFTHNKIPHNFF